MQLIDLFERNEEQTFNISDDDMMIVLKNMKNKQEFDAQDIMGFAKELIDEEGYTRSVGSARFLIQRMHVIIHGVAPHGVSAKTAAEWMTPSGRIYKFMEENGFDVEENIDRAKLELKTRKQKVKQDVATKMMSDFYVANKDKFDAKQQAALKAARTKIVKDIMAGESPADAFASVL